MNKRLQVACLVVMISVACIAQRTIDLQTGKMIDSAELKTNPIKQFEETANGYIVSYTYPFLQVETDTEFKNTYHVSISGLGKNSVEGEPEYLFQWDSFTVPDGKEVKIEIINSNYVDIPMELSPARSFYSDESKNDILPIQPYDGFFPNNVILEPVVSFYRDKSVADICVCPISYNYNLRMLRVYNQVTYRVKLMDCESNNKSRSKATIVSEDFFLDNITINGNQVSDRMENQQMVTTDYLIVSTYEFEDEVNRFAEWKRILGYNVHISLRDSWSVNDLKDEIGQIYDEKEALYYLLIVGDINDVQSEGYNECSGHYCYSDFFYGCIDDDLLPEIHVGRIPVSTIDEARVVFNKIMEYEKCPIEDDAFYNTGIHCADFDALENGVRPKPGSRFVQTSEIIKTYLNSFGRDVQRVYSAQYSSNPTFWEDNTPIPADLRKPDFSWCGNTDSIVNGINNGALYTYVECHGSALSWENPNFCNDDVLLLSNGLKMPVVFCNSCSVGQYWYPYCDNLSNALLKYPDGGSACVVAATSDLLTVSSDFLSIGLVNAIWPSPGIFLAYNNYSTPILPSFPVYNVGKIVDQGKVMMRYSCPSLTEETKYNMAVMSLYGDPSMELMTAKPVDFIGVSVIRGTNEITVSLSEDASISFYNTISKNVSSYWGNSIVFTEDPSNVIVSIRKHNKRPFIDYPGAVYIQNCDLSGSYRINANNIYVGSNVDSSQQSGPVEFSSGLIKLNGNRVEMRGTTTVAIGTVLRVNSNQ